MKKIVSTFLIFAVWCSLFASSSLAQKGTEQSMNDMIQLLEELQNDEEKSKDVSLPKSSAGNTKALNDPMAIFAKPKEHLKPADVPVEKNSVENIFETASETIPSDPVAPPSSQPALSADKVLTEQENQLNEIENNVNEMLKALEELEKNGQEGQIAATDPLDDFLTPPKSSNSGDKSIAEKSIEKKDEVVRLDPNGPDFHFQNGLVLWQSENLEAALHEFQEVIRLAPENAHAYWNLGLLYDKLNQGTEAIASLKKAEEVYSKYNYPEFAEDSKKRMKLFSEKYGRSSHLGH
jgi:predicted transglutaminase-like cysteine proteinase